MSRHLLILGGTAEAAGLAAAVAAMPGIVVTTSLAGRTRHPAALAGAVRIGGFGGADGLARYLAEAGIDMVVDATHPFAAAISAHAALACDAAGLPHLVLSRPAWRHRQGDNWIDVPDLPTAAKQLPSIGRRAFLTVGMQELGTFAPVRDVWFLVRMIGPPTRPPPLDDHHVILGRGPFSLADERATLEEYRIDVLVTKASGGAATKAKLVAARERGIPVVMVRRPPAPPGRSVESIAAALDWIAAI